MRLTVKRDLPNFCCITVPACIAHLSKMPILHNSRSPRSRPKVVIPSHDWWFVRPKLCPILIPDMRVSRWHVVDYPHIKVLVLRATTVCGVKSYLLSSGAMAGFIFFVAVAAAG